MASSSSSNGGAPADSWLVTVTVPNGNTAVPLLFVNQIWVYANSASMNYGSQICDCFVILIVLLAMTPKHRFRQATAIIRIFALTLNMICIGLLAYYFTSSWLSLFVIVAGDLNSVNEVNFDDSVAATILTIPIVMLIETSLFLQAWSIVQL